MDHARHAARCFRAAPLLPLSLLVPEFLIERVGLGTSRLAFAYTLLDVRHRVRLLHLSDLPRRLFPADFAFRGLLPERGGDAVVTPLRE